MCTFHYFQKLEAISKENENIQAQMNELEARFDKALSSDVSWVSIEMGWTQTDVWTSNCAVPEKILTHPMEGHRKLLGRGGSYKPKYKAKLEFPGGRGVQNKKPSVGGSMDIFWNCTLTSFVVLLFCSFSFRVNCCTVFFAIT